MSKSQAMSPSVMVGFIGGGNMAQSIIKGLLREGMSMAYPLSLLMSQLGPKSTRSQSTRSQVNSVPSQLGPKSTLSQVNSVPSHLGPKSSRSQVNSVPSQLGPSAKFTFFELFFFVNNNIYYVKNFSRTHEQSTPR